MMNDQSQNSRANDHSRRRSSRNNKHPGLCEQGNFLSILSVIVCQGSPFSKWNYESESCRVSWRKNDSHYQSVKSVHSNKFIRANAFFALNDSNINDFNENESMKFVWEFAAQSTIKTKRSKSAGNLRIFRWGPFAEHHLALTFKSYSPAYNFSDFS